MPPSAHRGPDEERQLNQRGPRLVNASHRCSRPDPTAVANASSAFSGMVLIVSGPTNSPTWRMSDLAGFFVPVEAQRTRWGPIESP